MPPSLEITSVKGDAVKAMFDGEVRLSRNMGTRGNVVVIRHRNGLETVYENNAQNLVKVGQSVQAGQTIAIVGMRDGRAVCTFSVMVNGARINPTTLVDAGSHRLYRQTLVFEKRGSHIQVSNLGGGSGKERGLTLDPDEVGDPFENSSTYKPGPYPDRRESLGLSPARCQGHQPVWRQAPPQRSRPQDQAQGQRAGCL